ncbi:hypothetical protein KI387_037307 [Taxus chinensis]|uniref:E3 ubiquitin-protein ligase listerin n=1 Tax=Taxus chinensis TaxID=29808 RepID=A0AA38KWK6_TAXCH|nr:hypothetical protein KI387_037307 [Taxus chinensis]
MSPDQRRVSRYQVDTRLSKSTGTPRVVLSSSAASLLQSGATGIGFGGYVGSSRIDTTLTKESNALLDVNGEVAQHLRRLSKKDPVTKIKALTSLGILFRQNAASDLYHIVPQWVFEYKRLVQDNGRQVRQAAHDAMANLAVTIGRGLAPHLRSVMGAWWLGQFDPYTEVAEAARRSFQPTLVRSASPDRFATMLPVIMKFKSRLLAHLFREIKYTPFGSLDATFNLTQLAEEKFAARCKYSVPSSASAVLRPSKFSSLSTNSNPWEYRSASSSSSSSLSSSPSHSDNGRNNKYWQKKKTLIVDLDDEETHSVPIKSVGDDKTYDELKG